MTTDAGGPQDGLDDLRLSIHTPDSWARAIAAAALEDAATNDDFGSGPVEIDAKFTVNRRMPTSDSETHSILQFCISIHDQVYCYGLSQHHASG